MTPTVSIAMPVYNGARHLAQTLDSILAQTYRDFELVISDNASTDETPAIVARYAAADPRIRAVRQETNLGASRNFRIVTELCRGRYIKHAAHDDTLAPTYLERCVAALEADPAAVLAYPLSVHVDENGRRLPIGPGQGYRISLRLSSPKPHERWREYHSNCHEHTGADPVFGLIRAEAMFRTKIVGPYIGSDLLLLAELSLLGSFVEIPEELFFYRLHAANSVRANPGREDRGSWFDPRNGGRLRNQVFHWEWLVRYCEAIARAPIGAGERARCYAQMPRWIRRYRTRLAGDLAAAAAYLWSRARPGVAASVRRFERVHHGNDA